MQLLIIVCIALVVLPVHFKVIRPVLYKVGWL